MTRKQIAVYLVAGLCVGLFLTACVGIASGKIDLPGESDTFVFGPGVSAVQAPAVAVPAVQPQLTRRHAEAREIREARLVPQAVPQTQADTFAELQVETGHWCSRP